MKNVEEFLFVPRNFAGLTSPYSDLETAKVAVLPVPYDSTTEWHSGTREGPASCAFLAAKLAYKLIGYVMS